MPSDRERFMRWVIGWRSTSRQDLRRQVWITSKEQEALDEERIAAWTSWRVAGLKADRTDGGDGRCEWSELGSVDVWENVEHSLTILF